MAIFVPPLVQIILIQKLAQLQTADLSGLLQDGIISQTCQMLLDVQKVCKKGSWIGIQFIKGREQQARPMEDTMQCCWG